MYEKVTTVLHCAADLCEGEGWSRRGFAIPHALQEVAPGDAYLRIIANRALEWDGVDTFWEQLVCTDGDEAAGALRRAAVHFSLPVLYGHNFEAVLGLIKATTLMEPSFIHGLGNCYNGDLMRLYRRGYEWLGDLGLQSQMDDLSSDLAYAVHRHDARNPSQVMHNLEALGALQGVGLTLLLGDRVQVGARIDVVDSGVLCAPLHSMLSHVTGY